MVREGHSFKIQCEKTEAIAHQKPFNPPLYHKPNHHTKEQSHAPKADPYAMDVVNVCLEPLSNEERERCYRENIYLHCRKPGHRANNCPVFPKSNNKPPPKKNQINFQKKPQPKKIMKIEPIEIEEVSEEEECIANVSVQDF